MLDITSLWGEEFVIDESKELTKKIIKKAKEPKEKTISAEKQIKSKKVSIEDKIKIITENVNKVLGKQKDNVLVIKTREQLTDYISKAIEEGIIAIDTETNNSLDPITCKLMGLCLYTPNNKQVYVPINHVDYKTGERLDWQLTEIDCKEELQRVKDSNIVILMHNAKFDYEVLKCTCDISIMANWDTMIAAKLIDENESGSLKSQYILHVDSEQEKYSIENLFEKQEYSIFPPEVFALYAATDSLMTYKLYEYQKPIMESPKFEKIYNIIFKQVEMPCVEVVASMELEGIELDMEYSKRLSDKYHDKLTEIDEEIEQELDKFKDDIAKWRLTPEANAKPLKKKKGTPNIVGGPGYIGTDYLNPVVTEDVYGKSKAEQLEEPINLGSPSQLAILLYDILKAPIVDESKPRGTGEEMLEKIDLPICKLILKRRGIVKLIDAFIDALPKSVNPKDKRIHGHFNQYGAATGRFSSSEPNMQQIPSHCKEIRMMFKARDGYTLVGSDFSQQEPRLLSALSGDTNMIQAYKDGKDLYATIAKGVYKMDYWDCMEHKEDGTPNPEGKKRRASCKSLLLGIMYSRGVASIAEQIHGSREEAQNIVDNFYSSFPKVKDIIDDSHEMAKKFGYVEDIWGRRRRLPDIQLSQYEVIDSKSETDFNPYLICEDKKQESQRTKKYLDMLKSAKSRKEKFEIIDRAKKIGLEVKDNGGFIAQAERQCLNARIQGSAATMTKIAMNKLYRDEELNRLGFKLLIGVHDELIGECPKENQDAVAERLTYVMKTCVEDSIPVPFKCDASVCDHWYLDEMSYSLQEKYNDMLKMGLGKVDSFHNIHREHPELTREQLEYMLEFK